jgi:hypothetical protein
MFAGKLLDVAEHLSLSQVCKRILDSARSQQNVYILDVYLLGRGVLVQIDVFGSTLLSNVLILAAPACCQQGWCHSTKNLDIQFLSSSADLFNVFYGHLSRVLFSHLVCHFQSMGKTRQ